MKLELFAGGVASRVPITPYDRITVAAINKKGQRVCMVRFEGLSANASPWTNSKRQGKAIAKQSNYKAVVGTLYATKAEMASLPEHAFEARAITQGDGFEIPLRRVTT